MTHPGLTPQRAAGKMPWVERGGRDGRSLLVFMREASTRELVTLSLDGASPPAVIAGPKPILTGAASASFSPDGQWIAYCDQSSKTPQVFIKRLSDGTRFQVSTDGGAEPLWASTGRELYFRAGARMMVVYVTSAADIYESASRERSSKATTLPGETATSTSPPMANDS